MNDEALQDNILFDRLADGELPATERQRLLASLDDRPDGWRRCAVAFLEAQAWRNDLKQIVRDADASAATARAVAPHRARIGGRSLRLWAMAASVLVAFTLGLAFRGVSLSLHRAAPGPGEQVVAVTPPSDSSRTFSTSPAPATKVDDSLTLWVRNEQGQPQALQVPLVDAETLDRQFGVQFRPGLSEAARDQLEQRGYDVRSKRRYAPFLLENGRPMIVPVEDTRIVPISQPVY